MVVEIFSDLDSLPESVASFLSAAAAPSFFASAAWYRIVLKTAGLPEDQPRLWVARQDGRAVAALFARERCDAGPLKTHVVTSPSRALDAFFYGPILDAEHGEDGLRAIIRAMLRGRPPIHILRFEALDPNAREGKALLAALGGNGLLLQKSGDPFVFYREDVEGCTVEQYLERRDPSMQAFLARQFAASQAKTRLAVVTGGSDLRWAVVDYALVDLQSWKPQEVHPGCLPALLEAAARAGFLRLGLLYLDEVPAAAQIWIVGQGRATMWRSRFARKFALQSVGAIITLQMIRHLLATDRPHIIEFGPGDDAGRAQWLSGIHERLGIAAYNLRTVKGSVAWGRHLLGRAAHRAFERLASIRGRFLARDA